MGGSTNWKFFGIVMAYVAVTYLLAWQFHFTVKQASPHHFGMFTSLFVFSIGILFLWCLYKDKPDRPFHYIPTWAKRYRASERARAAVPILILTALLLSTSAR